MKIFEHYQIRPINNFSVSYEVIKILLGNLIVFCIFGIPLILFAIWNLIYFNDRLYCLTHNMDYDDYDTVDYGYAKVYFKKQD